MAKQHWLLGCIAATNCLVLAIGTVSFGQGKAPSLDAIRLEDVSAHCGIDWVHATGGSGQQFAVEFTLGGLTLFDYDGDQWIDVYLLNGSTLPGTDPSVRPRNGLFRNLGNGTFRDVTEAAGVGDAGHGMGVAAADFDQDGDQDLYVNNFGPNVLYRNNGDGTFSQATEQAGVSRGAKLGAGACFLDIERDGDLDLYVANYLDFSFERHAELAPRLFPFPPGPQHYPAVRDNLFRNNGDGTFTDISHESGVASVIGPGMATVCGDFDDDGDPDIFVCNDNAANFLLDNDGTGRFRERGIEAGVAFDGLGSPLGNMGVDCADYNNDGRLDLFVTTYTAQLPVLFQNLGGGMFDDVTRATQAGLKVFPHVKWGTALVDLDHDGDRDLFIANGHFLVDIRKTDERTDFRVANTLLRNDRGQRFTDISGHSGSGLLPVESSRGVGFDDLDNDGDLDGVVLNVNARPTILQNRSAPMGHWIQVLLAGVQSNRDGVGSRVRVIAGELVQVAEVHSGRGYQSHFGTRLHFGVADSRRIDQVEVRWPSGTVEHFDDLPIDRLVVLVEGRGTASRLLNR